jgi:hypothetical protein
MRDIVLTIKLTHIKEAIWVIVIFLILIFSFMLGRITAPKPEIVQKPMTAADSLFDARWAQYEKDIADDTTYCTIDGKKVRCANIPTLGGFVDWKIKNNIK